MAFSHHQASKGMVLFLVFFAVAISLPHVAVSVEGKEYESNSSSTQAPCEDTELCIPSFSFA